MSLNPPRVEAPFPEPIPVPQRRYRWYHKLSALIFIVFCMELGLTLVVLPWTEAWDRNLFAAIVPEWNGYWTNPYVRGAVSGIGVINLYISFLEVLRLRRFAAPARFGERGPEAGG